MMKEDLLKIVKWTERYTKTDMLYVIKNSFWLNSSSVLTSIFSFILSILIAKFIDKEVYGTYQFILSIGVIINAFTLTGMNVAITNSIAKGEDDGILISSVKYQIKLSFIPFIIGLILSCYYFINGNVLIFYGILIVAIAIPLTNAFNTWNAYLNGKKDFKSIFLYTQFVNIIYYLSLILVIIKFPNLILLVFISLFSNLISNLIIYKNIIKKFNIKEKSIQLQESLNYGRNLSLSNILPIIMLQSDNLIIFHLLGPKMLAIYLFASNIPDRFISLLRPLSNIAFPKISSIPDENLYSNVIDKTFKLFYLSLFFAILYFFISEPLFKIFFNQYLTSVKYSQLYMLSLVASMTYSLLLVALQTRKSKYIYIINVIYPFLSLSLIYIGTLKFQITGTIIAKILSNIILLIALIIFLKRHK